MKYIYPQASFAHRMGIGKSGFGYIHDPTGINLFLFYESCKQVWEAL